MLTQLNPYVGGAAFAAVDGFDRARSLAGAEDLAIHTRGCIGPVRRRPRVTSLGWLAVWLCTLVTGSGPHAGDENVPRNGLDGMLLTRLHSSMVYATVAASVVCFPAAAQQGGAVVGCWSSWHRWGSVCAVPVRAADGWSRAHLLGASPGHCGDHQRAALRVAPPGDLSWPAWSSACARNLDG